MPKSMSFRLIIGTPSATFEVLRLPIVEMVYIWFFPARLSDSGLSLVIGGMMLLFSTNLLPFWPFTPYELLSWDII